MKSTKRMRANIAGIFELQPLEVRRFLTTASILSGNVLRIDGSSSSEEIVVNRLSNGRVSVTGVSTTFVSGNSAGQFNKIFVNAGGGNDYIFISGNIGSGIPSTISGGNGNDTMVGGAGADDFSGDGGLDTISYSARTSAVRVSLNDNVADGGNNGAEGDDCDAEEVLGTAGNDTLIGSGGTVQDFLAGGGGNDSITGNDGSDELIGNTGSDKLFGGGGNDALYAKHSDVDTVDGGAGDFDLASVDGIDITPARAAAQTAALNAVLQEAGVDPGQLDPTYGDEGGFTSGPVTDWSAISAAAVDSQGRVVLVGSKFVPDTESQDFVATRYNSDGTWDNTFAGDGVAEIGSAGDDEAFGVAIDGGDGVIIVGQSRSPQRNDLDVAVARLDSTGAVDDAFGFRTFDIFSDTQDDEGRDVLVDGDGIIAIVGTHALFSENQAMFVMRLTPTGTLDPNFNDGTGISTVFASGSRGSAIGLQPAIEGPANIIAAGTLGDDFVIARFDSFGGRDFAFGGNGLAVLDFGSQTFDVLNDVAVKPDGTIVTVGQSSQPVFLRLEPDPFFGSRGAIAEFSADGLLIDAQTYNLPQFDDGRLSYNAVAYDPGSGTVVVAGASADNVVLARFNGVALDPSFNGGAHVETDMAPGDASGQYQDTALGVALHNEKILVAGLSNDPFEQRTTFAARYGAATGGEDPEGPIDVVIDVEGNVTYEQVQSGFNDSRRSAGATFYLKSTLLDNQGRAVVDLTNGDDVVRLYKVVNEEGVEMVGLEFNGLVLHYGIEETTSITINGRNGHDSIIATDDVMIPLILNGGNGNNTLRGGGADDILRGENGLDQLGGGAGNDVLLGGTALDTLTGGSGNDILIGGLGGDELKGGDGEDILIGGTTQHDADNDALASLSAEWGSANPNATRIANLRNGGGLNGVNVLTAATVGNDGATDRMRGGGGRDWFFHEVSRDSILDNTTGEELTSL
ncbi:MAG TPA: hypothetical protein VGR35_06380 [Tepidisphaeraceae bacterium]|nr:hypothetical protein [Tepidisphaeraceae bacterium]